MTFHIYRNNTVEPLFKHLGATFSGYGDIAPAPADAYIWFYQAPISLNQETVAEEIASYTHRLTLLLDQLPEEKDVIAFTLARLYNAPIAGDDHRVSLAIADYNSRLMELSRARNNIKVVDFAAFAERQTTDKLIDWRFFFMSQMAINPKLAPRFGQWLDNELRALRLERKKCLVLDLDNTLWGGVLGEDGPAGIKIGGDYPGRAFQWFQEAIAELERSGVILAVCSKNNEADVLEAWQKNPFIALKAEHFAARRINWNNKADNIVSLSRELNIGLDSMVFIDDSPAERELVRTALPMVAVPDFPAQPYMLPEFMASLVESYFKVYTITGEDRQKTEQYRANARREREKASFASMDDYLKSLEMELSIKPMDEVSLPRIAQMTQKTNQFNLTTRRYTEADLRAMAAEGCRAFSLAVRDKFGDNGITGAIILRPKPQAWHIDTLLLSCRILGRGIESAFLANIINRLRREGAKTLTAEYRPTPKNAPTADFYPREGFALTAADPQGNKLYNADITTERTIKPYYKTTE